MTLVPMVRFCSWLDPVILACVGGYSKWKLKRAPTNEVGEISICGCFLLSCPKIFFSISCATVVAFSSRTGPASSEAVIEDLTCDAFRRLRALQVLQFSPLALHVVRTQKSNSEIVAGHLKGLVEG